MCHTWPAYTLDAFWDDSPNVEVEAGLTIPRLSTMMAAAQKRELRELRQLGYLISFAFSEPGQIDTVFRPVQEITTQSQEFETWEWGED